MSIFDASRRRVLERAALLAASTGMPGLWSGAAAAAPAADGADPAAFASAAAARIEKAKQTPGAMETLRAGDAEVLAVFDSSGAFPESLLPEPEKHPEWTAFMPGGRFPSIVRCFVIRTGGRTALVDAGNGAAKGGRLHENLKALGIAPEAVTDVLLTHLHGDHIGGLLLPDGKPAFPKAELHLSALEYDAWIEKGVEGAPAAVESARRTLAAYEALGRPAKRFDFGAEVLPNVQAERCTGHTAGHARFDVACGGTAGVVIAGDFLHIQPLQSRCTACSTRYDVHPEEAAATREALLASLADSGRIVAGAHFAFAGRVKRLAGEAEGGYAIEPLD